MVSTPETSTYIVVPTSRTVLFPESNLEIEVSKALGSLLKKRMEQGENLAVALAVKEGFDPGRNDPDTFFATGTLIELKSHTTKGSNDLFRANGRLRITVQSLEKTDTLITAAVTAAPDHEDMDLKSKVQMLDYIKNIAHEIAVQFKGSESYAQRIRQIDSIPEAMTYFLPFIPISMEEKQQLLEIDSLKDRGIAFMDILLKHKTSITLQIEMAEKFSHKSNERYRKAFLKEQLKQIHQELDEQKPESKGKKDYAKLIKEAKMPEQVEQTAFEELSKLKEQGQGGHEAPVIKNYLDLLVALPWQVTKEKDIDIDHAENLLDAHHYGQEKIKERILEHLSVMKLKKEKQGSILLLVGPPGTGKTSLGAGIARALDRKYVRISLGGVRDEAEIRGHRRTYVGALPGRIIQGIKKAGEKNPVFVLDEVDKLVSAFHGDPSSALLEVLDPEQNHSFSDHYLEVPYDHGFSW